jgi:hypothetical protein
MNWDITWIKRQANVAAVAVTAAAAAWMAMIF